MPRRILIVIAAVVGSLLVAPLVSAQDDPRETLREAREAREQNRETRAAMARDLDVLEATDEEMIAALEALSEQVLAQEQAVSVAESAVLEARAGEVLIQEEIAATVDRAASLKAMARDRAVAAYVAPRDDAGNERDITLLARREALFRYVDLDGRDLLDQLRAAEDDLDVLQIEAERRRMTAISLEADLETALIQLQQDVAVQEAIRAELGDTIAGVEAEIAAMAAAEYEIAAIIRDAKREVIRAEAIARAATSTTTTTTTTTTTAPPEDTPTGDNDSPGTESPDTAGSTTSTSVPDPASTTTTSAVEVVNPVVDPAELGLIWPTTGSVTSRFGTRVHPITGRTRHHPGLDIGNNTGTAVWASQSGVVIFSGRLGGYGEMVMVDHGSGVTTLYGHMSSRSVSEGTSVSQGTEVGKMGSTGYSTGPHLHFEVRLDNTAVNPLTYLS